MEIIYEDEQILVCRKEAGLPVQSGRVQTMDLVSMLKNHLREKQRDGMEPYLGIVHRLDQPVEGLLVFAKTKKAAASLSAQVQDGRMEKSYLAAAVISGRNLPDEGVLENWLVRDTKTNRSRIVEKKEAGAKSARLEYRILQRRRLTEGAGETALVQIHLFTGRHHQIRVQMAGAGMPLVGDRKYGQPELQEYGRAEGKAGVTEKKEKISLALCAWSLSFLHPSTGRQMEFQCEPEGEAFQPFTA